MKGISDTVRRLGGVGSPFIRLRLGIGQVVLLALRIVLHIIPEKYGYMRDGYLLIAKTVGGLLAETARGTHNSICLT
jgi:hypothetical protein